MELSSDLLRTFLAVADEGGFTRAAESIHLTQAAVSMQVKRLEENVGKSLFLRKGRKVSLTADGETLISYARRILLLQKEAMGALAKPELTGMVRIGTPDDYAGYLPPILIRFSKTHPKVQVKVLCQPSAELHDMMRKGEVDLILTTANCGTPTGLGTVARMEPLAWVASAHHWPEREDPIPLAVFSDGCPVRDNGLAALEAMGKPYRIAYASPSIAGLLAAVGAGLAVGLLAGVNTPDNARILGPEEGFPILPPVMLELYTRSGAAVGVLASHFLEVLRNPEAG
jgi:DNA-binding transcriptional LysR family regulator